jgi:ABC transporter C-terminal domain/ABC transporter
VSPLELRPCFSGAELALAAGDRVCLVGRNGSGKSTLLRIAAGLVQPDAGDRFAQPGAAIHYLAQEPDLSGFATTLAYVEAGFTAAAADSRHRALYLLKELGLSGKEDPAALSGGEALAQREPAGRGTPPAKPSVTKRPRPVTEVIAQPAARARRMSFNDRRALEMLPARITALQTQIAGLNAVVADPDLYARDPGRFAATTQALAVARDELAAAEEQWLTLEMLREEIDDVERKS